METIQGHGNIGRFIYWFNLLCQRIYNGGVLEPLRGYGEVDGEVEGKIGDFAYIKDGAWVETPALMANYRNGYQPNGSKAFSAFGYDFYLFRGVNLPEAKGEKAEGTFRVNNDAKYLAQQVVNAWRKLGGNAKLERDPNALVCVGRDDLWLSLYE